MTNSNFFLGIETSTTNCSVGLFKGDQLIDILEEGNGYSHSEKLGIFTKELLNRNAISISDICAIAIGVGPGSYTGLRIGVSFVKGLAFVHKIPIIKFTSLEIMANVYINGRALNEGDVLIPMIDARRDEVYCQVLDNKSNPISEVYSHVINSGSFTEYSGQDNKILCFGPGSFKLKSIVDLNNLYLVEGVVPSARGFSRTLIGKYESKCYEELAYFEPFYLKEFVAGKPKRSLLSLG